MTVKVTKPQINLREKISEVDKPSGIAGEAILRSETPQEVFNYIGAGRRNLIINGAMQVAQRGTSFTDLANGAYGLDRFSITKITDGAVDIKQTADAPTASEAGYLLTQCLHADVTTADASVSASNMYAILQYIEYSNISHVGFGQSGTRYLTASFWVKSTKTGTFCCFVKSADHARVYVKEYSVNSSDTWEHKTLTFPVDTGGGASWNHNSIGGTLGWTLYGGTDYQVTANTWTATTNNYAPCTSNQANALDSDANNFKITGVQLEVGTVATPFEHRSYGEELALCQRYFQRYMGDENVRAALSGNGGNTSFPTMFLVQTLRAAPSVTVSSAGDFYSEGLNGGKVTVASLSANATFKNTVTFDVRVSSGITGSGTNLLFKNSTGYLEMDAEL